MKNWILFVFMILSAPWLFGWGQNGHRIVAKICYDNLSRKAKVEVDKALGDNYLEQVSNWPDFIRSERNWKFADPWHYVTIDPDETVGDLLEETHKDDDIDNVVEAIELMQAILKDDAAAIDQFQKLMDKNKVEPLAGSIKATALAFLIHFIGDVHQPMHVGKNQDLGGNKISVLYFSEKTNLHSVWDSGLIDHEKLSYTEFSAFIEKHHRPNKEELSKTNPIEWAQESVTYREKIYNTLYDNTDRDSGLPSFSYNYQHDFIPVVEHCLAAAGYRAAAMLNEIFG